MPNNTPPGWASSRFDTSVPHSARIWNYWLGGKDNYAADRQAALRPRCDQSQSRAGEVALETRG